MDISTKAFLNDCFGSPDSVIAIIGRHWHDTPKRAAVEKWFYRDNVPGDWWLKLILALQAEDKFPDVRNYIEGGEVDVFA